MSASERLVRVQEFFQDPVGALPNLESDRHFQAGVVRVLLDVCLQTPNMSTGNLILDEDGSSAREALMVFSELFKGWRRSAYLSTIFTGRAAYRHDPELNRAVDEFLAAEQ